jgi:uncharacterized membrane protein
MRLMRMRRDTNFPIDRIDDLAPSGAIKERTMTVLILGLILFLGIHSARILADGARSRFIAKRGENTWKGLYSLISLAGFALIIWGYSLVRQQPVAVWSPPTGTRHLASLLTLIAFVLMAATYIPRNQIKARLHHPMVLGVSIWALAHLLSNGTLADLALFGSFLVWSVLSFLAAGKRDLALGTKYPPGTAVATSVTVVAGIVAWALFAFWLHGLLIGVRPLG